MKDRRFAIVAFGVFIALFAGIYFFMQSNSSPSDALPADTNSAAPNGSNNNSTTGTNSNSNTGGNPGSNANSNPGTNAGVTVPKEFVGKDDEWKAAFSNIINVQNQLFQKPNPSKVGQIMDPACSCYQETVAGMQDLKNKGWHVKGATTEIRAMALTGKTGNKYSVTATFAGGGGATVDKNDKVTEPGNTLLVPPIRYTLIKKDNGAWIIADRRPIQEVKK